MTHTTNCNCEEACTCTTIDDKPEKPTLSAEQIAALNKIVGNVDDDQDLGQGDLTDGDIDQLKRMFGLEN